MEEDWDKSEPTYHNLDKRMSKVIAAEMTPTPYLGFCSGLVASDMEVEAAARRERGERPIVYDMDEPKKPRRAAVKGCGGPDVGAVALDLLTCVSEDPTLVELKPYATAMFRHVMKRPGVAGVDPVLQNCLQRLLDKCTIWRPDRPSVATLSTLVRELWDVCCVRGACECGCCKNVPFPLPTAAAPK